MAQVRQFALIGYGALGREIGAALIRLGEVDALACVLTRPGREAPPFAVVHDPAAFGGSCSSVRGRAPSPSTAARS